MTESAPKGLAIQIRGLSKRFGRAQVLRKLDLDVPWGQVLTVLGPNGSGKTTLIRTIATLTRPDEGEVRVAGHNVAKLGHRVRHLVGVVTHEPLLYDELTGYENLRFAGRMFGLDRLDDRIDRAARRLGVEANLHQRAGTLSHGMRKRFSIARALLHNPPVLLMDEPESGLDQEALAMLDAVVQDGAQSSRTVVMTTHNLERGVALGHQLAVLGRGGIVYQGAADTPTGTSAMREAYFRHSGAKR